MALKTARAFLLPLFGNTLNQVHPPFGRSDNILDRYLRRTPGQVVPPLGTTLAFENSGPLQALEYLL